jgi:serine/threonine protein kinase
VRLVTIGGVGEYSLGGRLDTSSNSEAIAGFIAFAVVIGVLCLLIVFTIVFSRWYRKRQLRLKQLEDIKRRIAPAIIEILSEMHGGQFIVPRNIALEHLKGLETLGTGKFGIVIKGILNEYDDNQIPGYAVAMKIPKDEFSQQQREELKFEAAIMAQFTHPNVVGLIGQVSEKVEFKVDGQPDEVLDIFILVSQYCEFGSMLSWLKQGGRNATAPQLTLMLLDVARGMTYLSTLGIVHRDLAARNVLVASDLSCKIADFGFARHTVTGETFENDEKFKVAVLWVAPEAYHTRCFTSKSDVWSFAVLAHEVFSFGMTPYEENQQVRDNNIFVILDGGYRLPQQTLCTDEIYQHMLYSWSPDPKDRPDFPEWKNVLRRVYHTTLSYDVPESRLPIQTTVKLINSEQAFERGPTGSIIMHDKPALTVAADGPNTGYIYHKMGIMADSDLQSDNFSSTSGLLVFMFGLFD